MYHYDTQILRTTCISDYICLENLSHLILHYYVWYELWDCVFD